MKSPQSRQRIVDAWIQRRFPEALAPKNSEADALFKLLKSLPFWCGDRNLHIKNPAYQDVHCCLTHTVGLPLDPATNHPMPLTPYQVEFFNTVQKGRKRPRGMSAKEFARTPHKYHVNKGRQMGFTEIVLRIIQYETFHNYSGYNVGIMAATTSTLAMKDLRRFARLYRSIPNVVAQWVKNATFILADGTKVEAFKANEESITGDTAYKCIFLDESAKWKLIDDAPVFNSIEPIINAAGGDLFLVSTPKGPIKTFYQIHKTPKTYIKIVYDIWHSEGNMYTRKQILDMLESSQGDPAQEYLCKFQFGQDSVLGAVTDADRVDESEWGVTGDEDDGYIEPDDTDPGAGAGDEEWRP